MNILIEGMSDGTGGKETYILNAFTFLNKEGHRVSFLAYDDKIAYEDYLRENGAEIIRIPPRKNGIFAYLFSIRKAFFTKKYDVFWSHKTTLSSCEALAAAWRAKVPVRIVHSHCSQNMGGLFTAVMHFINKQRIGGLATVFLACSPTAGKYFYKKKNSYRVMHNAFDIMRYSYDPQKEQNCRKELNLGASFVLGHVGRFSREKNHPKMIGILEELCGRGIDARLLLCGDGAEMEKTRELAQRSRVENKVLFLGVRNDVDYVLQCMDVFLFPSIHEGLPFALLEAQAAGVPCVISDRIPDEAVCSDYVKKLGLDVDDRTWGDICLEFRGVNKAAVTNSLSEHGFDSQRMRDEIITLFEKD